MQSILDFERKLSMKRFFLLLGTLILVSAVLMLIGCSTKPNDNPSSTEQSTAEQIMSEQTTPEEPVQVEYKCQYCNKAFDSEAEKNKHEANCPMKDQRQDNDPHKGAWDF